MNINISYLELTYQECETHDIYIYICVCVTKLKFYALILYHELHFLKEYTGLFNCFR